MDEVDLRRSIAAVRRVADKQDEECLNSISRLIALRAIHGVVDISQVNMAVLDHQLNAQTQEPRDAFVSPEHAMRRHLTKHRSTINSLIKIMIN